MKKYFWILIVLLAFILVSFTLVINNKFRIAQSDVKIFDGQRAYQDVVTQVGFGPRVPGSVAHMQTVKYIQDELEKNGWATEGQNINFEGHPIENVIAKRGHGSPWIIIGAHYDTRMAADRDPDPAKQNEPVPGANDGASGVAVLLELCRILPKNIDGEIWLAFFDAEDQGNLPGWDWILGSQTFVEQLTISPDAVVIADMVGDSYLSIYQEGNSDPILTKEIWAAAQKLSYEQYIIPEVKYTILDDHTPFLEKGIPAVDMIDFDYPYWHTTQDTIDKVSAESLKIVGDTLSDWIFSNFVGKY